MNKKGKLKLKKIEIAAINQSDYIKGGVEYSDRNYTTFIDCTPTSCSCTLHSRTGVVLYNDPRP